MILEAGHVGAWPSDPGEELYDDVSYDVREHDWEHGELPEVS